VDAAASLRRARLRAGLTLRSLADRAGTSHATLAAYERGAKVPRVDTLDRVLRAAGFAADLELAARADGQDRAGKGRELVDALELAGAFPVPARRSRRLTFPPFGPVP
jgi:transcriptional regulator with XRE-family HTH domain